MIVILRLGHRLPRDERISTHVALAGRAFGADGIVYSGQHDSGLEKSVSRINEQWGGNFWIRYEKKYEEVVNEYKKKGFLIVHLTMYGIQFQNEIDQIKKNKDILIIVGGQAVPSEIFELSDFNISVTNQPHSEVSALGVFLYEYFDGKIDKKFENRKIEINPSKKGKQIVKNKD